MSKLQLTLRGLSVFLGATLSLLLKANSRDIVYYYQTVGSCVAEQIPPSCQVGGTGCTDDQCRQLYQTVSLDGKICFNPLKEDF